ncbi:MAG: hypothetical protein ABEJ69_01820 [Candidatus Nanohaloarchaea archaeon]
MGPDQVPVRREFWIQAVLFIAAFTVGFILASYFTPLEEVSMGLELSLSPLENRPDRRYAEKGPVTGYGYNDPAIFKENGTYYLFATLGAVNVLTSPNGTDYVSRGMILNPGIDVEISRAPESRKREYWMFYQVDEEEIRIAKSDNLKSGWEESGVLISADNLSVPAVGEPSVIHDREASEGKEWKMLFTGGSGDDLTGDKRKWGQTWYAYSPEGDSNWTVPEYNPVLTSSSDVSHV